MNLVNAAQDCSAPPGPPPPPPIELTDFGLGLGAFESWADTVEGADGKLYGIPSSAEHVLVIDPVAQSAVRNDFGVVMNVFANQWSGGVLAANGKIYCSPSRESEVLVIDTNLGTATRTDFGISMGSADNKWGPPILASNGKIYCAPFYDDRLLVINPATETAYTLEIGAPGQPKWFYLAEAPSGNIVSPPHINFPTFFRVVPSTDAADVPTFGLTSPTFLKGAARGPDGRIYSSYTVFGDGMVAVNEGAESAIVQTFNNDISTTNLQFGLTLPDERAVFVGNSIVIVTSAITATVAAIDPPHDGTGNWRGGAYSSVDGRVYCAPMVNQQVLIFDPDAL